MMPVTVKCARQAFQPKERLPGSERLIQIAEVLKVEGVTAH